MPLSRYVYTGGTYGVVGHMAQGQQWEGARGDREGLGVRITPRGKITFQLRYRFGGKPKRLDLGSYPLMSLKGARAEAQRLRARHERGHDPQIVRVLEKQAIIKADSIESLFRQWYEAYCTKNRRAITTSCAASSCTCFQ